MAEHAGVCVRPVLLRAPTGTPATPRSSKCLWGPAGIDVKPCAERGRRLCIQQIRDGWHLATEPAVPVDPADGVMLEMVWA